MVMSALVDPLNLRRNKRIQSAVCGVLVCVSVRRKQRERFVEIGDSIR